jgi:hypothetical protein
MGSRKAVLACCADGRDSGKEVLEGEGLRQMETDAGFHAADPAGDFEELDADLIEAGGGEFGTIEDTLTEGGRGRTWLRT